MVGSSNENERSAIRQQNETFKKHMCDLVNDTPMRISSEPIVVCRSRVLKLAKLLSDPEDLPTTGFIELPVGKEPIYLGEDIIKEMTHVQLICVLFALVRYIDGNGNDSIRNAESNTISIVNDDNPPLLEYMMQYINNPGVNDEQYELDNRTKRLVPLLRNHRNRNNDHQITANGTIIPRKNVGHIYCRHEDQEDGCNNPICSFKHKSWKANGFVHVTIDIRNDFNNTDTDSVTSNTYYNSNIATNDNYRNSETDDTSVTDDDTAVIDDIRVTDDIRVMRTTTALAIRESE